MSGRPEKRAFNLAERIQDWKRNKTFPSIPPQNADDFSPLNYVGQAARRPQRSPIASPDELDQIKTELDSILDRLRALEQHTHEIEEHVTGAPNND